MRHYKQLSDNYITAIGTGYGGTEITEAEYSAIMAAIQSRPQAEGTGYRLKADLSWEEYDLPPQPEPEEPELTAEEALAELDAAYREGVDSL